MHKRIRAGRRETWCENRFYILVFFSSVIDPADRVFRGNSSTFFLKFSGSVAIHVDLADIGSETCAFHEIHQKFSGFYMQSREYAGTGGGASSELFGKDRISLPGIGKISVPGFFRKGDLIQPFQQFQIHVHTVKCILWSMKMKIVHSGNDKLFTDISDRNSVKLCRKLWKNTDGASVLTDDKSIFKAGQFFRCCTEADGTSDGKCGWFHMGYLLFVGDFQTKKIPNIYARKVPRKKLIDATITVVGRNVQPIMDLYKFDVV